MVAKAVREGHLPAVKTLACVDCGRGAQCYDHRDYTKPLDVEPVCRSCNVMRGPAEVWPAGFEELNARVTHQREGEPA